MKLRTNLVLLIAMLISLTRCEQNRTQIEEKLQIFLSTLERYASTPNEVVFLIDESGSIGASVYEKVKIFTDLVIRRLSVSSEYSRIAIVSFSDYTRTHVNYIQDNFGNNMCTLVQKIKRLDYIGSGTRTSLAMEEAREILVQSRPYSNRILVLITDGMSNQGYSPVGASIRMKREGVIIFAVGVADVNEKEVEDVATSIRHIYILKDFSYIEKLNTYLIKETNEIAWDFVRDSSMCNTFCDAGEDCCDDHAQCYCGTIGGNYECACDAGYHGTGHKQGCHPCPKGTFKDAVGKKGCSKCPEHSTTSREGSTSSTNCSCETGYEMHGTYCKAIECAKLQAPDGGILVPTKCDSIYGTKCSAKCKEGYCPYSCNYPEGVREFPFQTRVCLETGKWSGDDFHCEKMRCSVLDHPFNGKHNCSQSNFDFGTTCHFACDEGYEMDGSDIRKCLINGTWTGTQTLCKGIQCDPLKHHIQLKVKPKQCISKKMPYHSVCQYYCAKGYSLTSEFGEIDGINKCLGNKTWSGAALAISCTDISPPTIRCPPSIVTETDRSKETALMMWEEPVVSDNVFVSHVAIKSPSSIRKSPYAFPIGSTKLIYQARDSSNLASECSFTVDVIDKEPPKVLFCSEDIKEYHPDRTSKKITWQEPKFSDNSGRLTAIRSNRKSGDEFSWGGPYNITYSAFDPSGNEATCTFSIQLRQYPCLPLEPPANGAVTCDEWMEGRMCSIFCHDGYDFPAKNVPTIYECNQKGSGSTKQGKWMPFPKTNRYKIPVPDCSKRVKRSAVSLTYEMNYTVVTCNDEIVEKLRKKFIDTLMPWENKLKGMICPANKGCRPENVNVSCGSQLKKIHKRSLNPSAILSISFNVELFPEKNEDLTEHIFQNMDSNQTTDASSYAILQEVKSIASENVRTVYNVTSLNAPDVRYEVNYICSVGQIRKNDSCVSCSAGTYKNDLTGTCTECPFATYQEEEGSTTCKACPEGYATYQKRSKHFQDCKAPCQPGTYSKTTFEPCYLCPLNTYQNSYGSKECLKCPNKLLTWELGSNSSGACVSPCAPGSFSDTGLEPCDVCDFGFYQEHSQQKLCKICPNGTSIYSKGSTSLSKCVETNECELLNPCSNFSTCVPLLNGYTCVCGYGQFGKHCENSTAFCELDSCLNNGTCINQPGGVRCLCPEGFSGISCEINIDDCKNDSCDNGGECLDLVNDYTCLCPPGYSGPKCEWNVMDCTPDSCLNGGTCFDKLNGFKCCCPTGYVGSRCEQKVNSCESILCQNDGVCEVKESQVGCTCKAGFDGEHCEINVDECLHTNCYNNGTCIDGVNDAICKCTQKYTGDHCEEEVTSEYSMNFKSALTSNYVELHNPRILNAITVSFFMRVFQKDSENHPTVVSYSYFDEEKKVVVDNGLTLFDLNRIVLYIHGEMLHTGYVANSDFNWHHYAVTWERNDGKWSLYVDGKLFVDGLHVGDGKRIWPGVFIIGQEQDSLGGTFSRSEAFAGEITEFNVWDYAVSEDEIIAVSSVCGTVGNVIPWFVAKKHIHGNITLSENVDVCKDIGSCSGDDCYCFYSNEVPAGHCKHSVKNCNPNPCNGQPCIQNSGKPFCDCSSGYDGKFCEYDINECLVQNGGCSHLCVNSIGSYNCQCPENMHLDEDKFNCKDTSFCRVDEKIYLDGETWTSNCEKCFCEQGNVKCQNIACNSIECLPEENLVSVPGECCPRCVLYSFCLISANNTISTFDFSLLEFTDKCSYTLVEDCINGDFSVQYQPVRNTSLESHLSIYESCSKTRISQTGELTVKDHAVVLPFKDEMFRVESFHENIDVWSHSGLHVQWHASGEILIAVPSEKAKSLCGICGHFQGYHMENEEEDKEAKGSSLVKNHLDVISFFTLL